MKLIIINISPSQNWPNADVPNFRDHVMFIYKNLTELALRVLSVMAIGLGLVRIMLLNLSIYWNIKNSHIFLISASREMPK